MSLSKIAVISSFAPKRCGIATFTADLLKNISKGSTDIVHPIVFAMDSNPPLSYAEPVKFKIRREIKHDYLAAADYINFSNIELVSIQHEFGLFGGDGGSYLTLLLEKLRKPVVTTLHTVLEKPSASYKESLEKVCRHSSSIVVMNKRGVRMLRDIYGVPEKRIVVIPHGIPDLPFSDSSEYKSLLGLGNRPTILTFGLLSRNKGIESMLQAMPAIVKAHPDILYIVLGATHPEVLRHEGQAYKNSLRKSVAELGLSKNVMFVNKFVDDGELSNFLLAADIYVTPYLHKEQLTSGTLAFAVGAGKPVVSTPYWAAQELLARGRGKLVPFGKPHLLAEAVTEICQNPDLRDQYRRKAYEYGRSTTWKQVGRLYRQLFEQRIVRPVVNQEKSVSACWSKAASAGSGVHQSA